MQLQQRESRFVTLLGSMTVNKSFTVGLVSTRTQICVLAIQSSALNQGCAFSNDEDGSRIPLHWPDRTIRSPSSSTCRLRGWTNRPPLCPYIVSPSTVAIRDGAFRACMDERSTDADLRRWLYETYGHRSMKGAYIVWSRQRLRLNHRRSWFNLNLRFQRNYRKNT